MKTENCSNKHQEETDSSRINSFAQIQSEDLVPTCTKMSQKLITLPLLAVALGLLSAIPLLAEAVTFIAEVATLNSVSTTPSVQLSTTMASTTATEKTTSQTEAITSKAPEFASETTPLRNATGFTTDSSSGDSTSVSKSTISDPSPTAMSTSTAQGTHAITTAISTSQSTHNQSVSTLLPNVTGSSPLIPTSFYFTLTTPTLGEHFGLSYSEKAITIFLSIILGVAVLVLFMYSLNKCKKKKTQYVHRPLYNNHDDTVNRYRTPEDTLVISGGLYDGPQIYNPNMTVLDEDDEFHSENPAFTNQPPQFRLEFLSEEQERSPDLGVNTFETFNAPTEET
ncbi:uncharacterized protein [Lepisosteus oculatus]|uniref:uncharacterized protein n=1 Tax=Lepisosteus oculatus TaxID=7918 RepID=UPI003714DDF1